MFTRPAGNLGRDRHVECIQVFCSCGQECLNQRIRKGLQAKTSVFDAGLKGCGLRAAEDLEVGKLVAEYVGEVISADEAAKRCDEYEEQRIKHMYLFQTRNGALIDATRKGEPVVTCLCGSAECRGFLDSAMPGQTYHRKRPFSAMAGEELRARTGFGDAPQSSRNQGLTMSTENATSSHARQPSGGAISKSSSKRSGPAKSRSQSSIKAGSSDATHSASRGSAKASAGGPAKSVTTHSSKAAGQSRAEDGTISVPLLKGSWAGTGVRTAVSKKQRIDRRHPWGFSLADHAAIPSRQSGAPANLLTANLPGGGGSSSVSVASGVSGTASAPSGVRESADAGTSAGAGKSTASVAAAPQAATELSQSVDSSRDAEAAQAMPSPPQRSSLHLPQAAVARQQGAAARPSAQLSPAAGQAPILPRAGVKNNRHGVKPPLYPAKRVKSPDGGSSSTAQATAGHAAGTAASPTTSIANNASYTATEPEIGTTVPNPGAPDKPDATVNATPPSTYAHTGATAEVAVACCTGVDEVLVPGVIPDSEATRHHLMTEHHSDRLEAETQAEIKHQLVALLDAHISASLSELSAHEGVPHSVRRQEQTCTPAGSSRGQGSASVVGHTSLAAPTYSARQDAMPHAQSQALVAGPAAAGAASEQGANTGSQGQKKSLMVNMNRGAETEASHISSDAVVSLVPDPTASSHHAARAQTGGDSHKPNSEHQAQTHSPRTSIRRAGRRVDTFAILAHELAAQDAAKDAAAARDAQARLTAERLQAIAEPNVGSTTGATHVAAGNRPHHACLQKPLGSQVDQSAELSPAAVTKQPQRAAAVTAADASADINFASRRRALSQAQATAGVGDAQAAQPGTQGQNRKRCLLLAPMDRDMERTVRSVPLLSEDAVQAQPVPSSHATAAAQLEGFPPQFTSQTGPDASIPSARQDQAMLGGACQQTSAEATALLPSLERGTLNDQESEHGGPACQNCQPDLTSPPQPDVVDIGGAPLEDDGDDIMAQCPTEQQDGVALSTTPAHLSGSGIGNETMTAIAEQGLPDIRAVRSTPSATGSGLDQPSFSQLQHWALTDKLEKMLVNAAGQEQAADSGHSLVATVLHVAPTLRQPQQQTALTYNSTWRPGQDPWLPLFPHAPKQNLRAWKTVPGACPQDDDNP
ncbi:hypothetical protein WJX79_000255 [Trebouxia sp. C0005]